MLFQFLASPASDQSQEKFAIKAYNSRLQTRINWFSGNYSDVCESLLSVIAYLILMPRFDCGSGMLMLRLLEFSIILRFMDSKMQHLTEITIPTIFGGKFHLFMETPSTNGLYNSGSYHPSSMSGHFISGV